MSQGMVEKKAWVVWLRPTHDFSGVRTCLSGISCRLTTRRHFARATGSWIDHWQTRSLGWRAGGSHVNKKHGRLSALRDDPHAEPGDLGIGRQAARGDAERTGAVPKEGERREKAGREDKRKKARDREWRDEDKRKKARDREWRDEWMAIRPTPSGTLKTSPHLTSALPYLR
ncbi:hypothetical protein JHW43_003689 [Diplocarpon mali]|nr:hypothetical protein JHW43_003689 [Diplocarpon mali]